MQLQSFTFALGQRNWVTWHRRRLHGPESESESESSRGEIRSSSKRGGVRVGVAVWSLESCCYFKSRCTIGHNNRRCKCEMCSRYWTWPLKDSAGYTVSFCLSPSNSAHISLSLSLCFSTRLSAHSSVCLESAVRDTPAPSYSRAENSVTGNVHMPSPSKQQGIRIFVNTPIWHPTTSHRAFSHTLFICIISCSCEPTERQYSEVRDSHRDPQSESEAETEPDGDHITKHDKEPHVKASGGLVLPEPILYHVTFTT